MGRRKVLRWLLGLCGLLIFTGFTALGNWQLERRIWKQELMQRVEQRVRAPAIAAPDIEHWSSANRQSDEYRRVYLEGHFLDCDDTLVVAATELGSGYWVLTPFQRRDDTIVFVNRGFISQGVAPTPPPAGEFVITGLLRLNEPKGTVLRDNDPAQGRWYSRDIVAIAAAQSLKAALYFVDAANGEPGSSGDRAPVGGLTVISFHNNHLVYALTWYGLAVMVVVAAVIVRRERHQLG